MKRTLTALITTAFAIFTTSSCQEINCPAFDIDHDMMDWYFVPGLDMEVNYVDTNGIPYVFNRTAYNASEAYIEKCGGFHKCQCSPTHLNTIYYNSNLDITFRSTATYYFEPMLTIFHDSAHYELTIDMANDYIFSNDTAYTVTPIDTFNIFNSTYMDVFEINAPNESFKFWLQKNNGMIAFEKNSIRYKIN